MAVSADTKSTPSFLSILAYKYKIYMECLYQREIEMQEIKNILIVHNYYQIPGGEDMVVENEKRMLEEYGHKVFLYSRNNLELNTFTKMQKLCLPFSFIFSIKTYVEIKKIIKNRKIDIVHVHNTLSLISSSVYYAALKCDIPVVQTVHNFRLLCPCAVFYREEHICEDCVNYGLQRAIKHKCYRNSRIQTLLCVINTKIHRMTGIYRKINYICLTEFNKEKLLQLKQIKKENVYIKPNFSEFNKLKDKSKKVIPSEKRKNQFVFAGRLDKLKGIDLLLKAWKIIERAEQQKITESKRARLIICGTGPMEKWCRQYIKKNQLHNVVLKGFVSNQEVIEIIARSKALILPTQWYEGFPMSIVEAFSVGTPVITSSFGNANDIVKQGITGCKFKQNTAKGLAEEIKKLEEYKDIYNTTLKQYKLEYTKKQNYEKLISIYKKILNHSQRGV